MVAAGIGVSLVPSCIRSLDQSNVAFIPIQPNPPPIGLVAARPKGQPSPAVGAFLDMLRQNLPRIRSKYAGTYKTLALVAGSARHNGPIPEERSHLTELLGNSAEYRQIASSSA
jgi:hypothetical protein